jgi:hypothetical protein
MSQPTAIIAGDGCLPAVLAPISTRPVLVRNSCCRMPVCSKGICSQFCGAPSRIAASPARAEHQTAQPPRQLGVVDKRADRDEPARRVPECRIEKPGKHDSMRSGRVKLIG